MKKNVDGQVITFQAIATDTGLPVTTGTPSIYYEGDGGGQASGTGTATHKGNGTWLYEIPQAETNYDHVAFTFTLVGAINQTLNTYPGSLEVNLVSTQSTAFAVQPTEVSELAVNQGLTWRISYRGLGNITDATSLLWHSLAREEQADSNAHAQILLTVPADAGDGLQILDGAAAGDATAGSITITDAVAGDVDVILHASATASPPDRATYFHDLVKVVAGPPEEKDRLAKGKLKITP